MAKKANLGANFYPKLVQISSEVGMKPEDLLVVMISESGLNPGAVESKFKGSGLLGFMPSTLDKLGFKGTWEDFSSLSGEQQLDYVKPLVKNNMQFNGGPFTSAAQYYVGNFWPLALKLPGIKSGDANTAFLEANPETVIDPKTGKKYSKKYYDLGYKITGKYESGAYKANPLFDKDKKGAITYGDMMKQVDRVRSTATYQKALNALKSTGYQPNEHYKNVIQFPTNKVKTNIDSTDKILNDFLQRVAASEKNNKNIYKKFLPQNDCLIQIKSASYINAVEFARILCAVLEEEILAKTAIHVEDKKVEVECSVFGPTNECFEITKQLVNATTDVFQQSRDKLGRAILKTEIFINKKSSYQPITFKEADRQYKKFLLRFLKG